MATKASMRSSLTCAAVTAGVGPAGVVGGLLLGVARALHLAFGSGLSRCQRLIH